MSASTVSALSKTALSPYIKSLLLKPPNLTTDDLAVALRLIFQQIPAPVQVASFLTALTFTGLDRDPRYIATAVRTILEFSEIPSINTSSLNNPDVVFADIVGTGGDGQNTFNVSTSSAIVVAGIQKSDKEVVVVKHGGKASTSVSGSGDFVGKLGIPTSKVTASTVGQLVESDLNKFVFLFAPSFHRGMHTVAEIRKLLGIPTIFNILGPLLNPVPLHSRVLGVYAEELGPIYAASVRDLYPEQYTTATTNSANKYSTVVVWGEVGLDEVAPIGKTRLWYIDPVSKEIRSETIGPEDFGLPEHTLQEVRSGTPEENAKVLRDILENSTEAAAVANEPILDYILMNSSVLAVSSGLAKDWKEGVALSRDSIRSGRALQALNRLVETANKLE